MHSPCARRAPGRCDDQAGARPGSDATTYASCLQTTSRVRWWVPSDAGSAPAQTACPGPVPAADRPHGSSRRAHARSRQRGPRPDPRAGPRGGRAGEERATSGCRLLEDREDLLQRPRASGVAGPHRETHEARPHLGIEQAGPTRRGTWPGRARVHRGCAPCRAAASSPIDRPADRAPTRCHSDAAWTCPDPDAPATCWRCPCGPAKRGASAAFGAQQLGVFVQRRALERLNDVRARLGS